MNPQNHAATLSTTIFYNLAPNKTVKNSWT